MPDDYYVVFDECAELPDGWFEQCYKEEEMSDDRGGLKDNESRVGSTVFDDGQGIGLVILFLFFGPVIVALGAGVIMFIISPFDMLGVVASKLFNGSLGLVLGLVLAVVVYVFVKFMRFITDPFDHKYYDEQLGHEPDKYEMFGVDDE